VRELILISMLALMRFTFMGCDAGRRARLAGLVVVLATRSRYFGQGIGRRPDTKDPRVGIQI
jgi:hypothetical protein